ncbi:MAG TPA: ATP-binding protein [bacterium]|nr:ATP-binding protein [bacterium]
MHNGPTGTMAWTLTIRVYSEPTAMRTVRKLVNSAARLAGASEADAYDLEVAVGEAVTNAYLHAYGGKTEGQIDVDLGFNGKDFLVSVHDGGKPVTDRITIPETPPESGHGRGLFLIGQLMDEVTIVQPDRGGQGVAVRMSKNLTG